MLNCVDIVVLVIQHKLTGRRSPVEMLIRKKMRSEILTEDLIRDTFRQYGCVLKDFYEPISCIADSLLMTKDPLIVPSGSLFYKEMFIHFDEYCQQEVVQALIQHICSGGESGSSADSPAVAAIAALQDLASNHWEDLVKLSGFLITLLEYLDYMSLPQVKRIMELLSKMAYGFAFGDQSREK